MIGQQGKGRIWLAYGSRCFLAALEHLRGVARDEVIGAHPDLEHTIEVLRRAENFEEYTDLTQSQGDVSEKELAAALSEEEKGVENIDSEDEDDEGVLESVDVQLDGVEAVLAENPAEICGIPVPTPPVSADTLQPRIAESPFIARAAEGELQEQPRVKIPRLGPAEAHTVFAIRKAGKVLTQKLKQKMLEKEVPYKEISEEHRSLYHAAEEKEWASWLDFGSVRVLSKEETNTVWQRWAHRVLRSRFVYRDKNASLRTLQRDLEVAAKARLCLQGQNCPDNAKGLLKTDAPCIARNSVFCMLQVAANLG